MRTIVRVHVALSGLVGAMASSPCLGTEATLMAAFNYTIPGTPGPALLLHVCEDLSSPNGAVNFMQEGKLWLSLPKRVESIMPKDDNRYGDFTKREVLQNTTDILGNSLLGIHGHARRKHEPTLAEITTIIPPLRSINSCRIWTANRISGRDATFDRSMENFGAGGPTPVDTFRGFPVPPSTLRACWAALYLFLCSTSRLQTTRVEQNSSRGCHSKSSWLQPCARRGSGLYVH